VLASGLGVAVIAAIGLVAAALERGDPRRAAGIVVYAAALLAMLGFALLYRSAVDPERRRRFRRFDHAAIFAMIAGSATPFALVQPGARGLLVAAALWVAAMAGIAFKLRYPIQSLRRSALSYVVLGWAALLAVGPAISPRTAVLIALGGIFYSVGVPVLLWRRRPYRLAIWHGIVLTGAACHYIAILLGVVLG
jgi:hemolysin III